MAGFDKVRLIPEPTAAALAYKVSVEQQNQYIAVMDLGAGTLDVTVALLYLNNDALQTAEKGHGGDTALGGIDLDDALLQHVVKTHDLRRVMKDSHGRARLRAEVERAKIELSDAHEAKVAFPSSGGNVNFVLRREEVEAAVSSVVGRCVGPIKVALTEANLSTRDLSHVLLVGGPTKMPLIRRMVAKVFADNPSVRGEVEAIGERGFPVDPMEAVARGAVLGGFGGVTPHAYGVSFEGAYYALVPRRTRYPCTNSASWLVSSKKRWIVLNLIQSAIDPQGSQRSTRCSASSSSTTAPNRAARRVFSWTPSTRRTAFSTCTSSNPLRWCACPSTTSASWRGGKSASRRRRSPSGRRGTRSTKGRRAVARPRPRPPSSGRGTNSIRPSAAAGGCSISHGLGCRMPPRKIVRGSKS